MSLVHKHIVPRNCLMVFIWLGSMWSILRWKNIAGSFGLFPISLNITFKDFFCFSHLWSLKQHNVSVVSFISFICIWHSLFRKKSELWRLKYNGFFSFDGKYSSVSTLGMRTCLGLLGRFSLLLASVSFNGGADGTPNEDDRTTPWS